MHKYQQVNFFSNVKSVKPTYGNKEELATLTVLLLAIMYGLFNHCSRTTENFRVAEVAMLSYGKPAD